MLVSPPLPNGGPAFIAQNIVGYCRVLQSIMISNYKNKWDIDAIINAIKMRRWCATRVHFLTSSGVSRKGPLSLELCINC